MGSLKAEAVEAGVGRTAVAVVVTPNAKTRRAWLRAGFGRKIRL
jgi:hypothetical protein